MKSRLARLGLTVLAMAAIAYAQKPVIYPGGVVNAASYGKYVAHGSVVAIFGENLAAGPESAEAFPLPTTLNGTSVSVKGVAAPIFYVSPGQINIQFPSSLPLGPPEDPEVIVTTPAGASDPVAVEKEGGFGIFTLDASGCGRAAVLNVRADGSRSLNSTSNSVSPGEYLEVYGTGLGRVYNPPPDGSPTPPEPLAWALFRPPKPPWTGSVIVFAGRAPGFVGVDQVNYQVPETWGEGCEVPISVVTPRGRSQYVPVSIRRGGGSCVDPPTESYGLITWERTITSGITEEGQTEVLTAAFPAAPGLQAPVLQHGEESRSRLGESFGPVCPLPGHKNLDAGTVTLEGPGFGPVEAVRAVVDGQTVYRAILPDGTIQPGSFQVTASGGADVNPFQSTVEIASGINITSAFPPGTELAPSDPIVVNWTGGDPDSWVTAKLLRFLGPNVTQSDLCRVRTSVGTVQFWHGPSAPPWPGPEYDIILEVTPDPADIPALSVPGLSLGGHHTWKYTYRFAGLRVQGAD